MRETDITIWCPFFASCIGLDSTDNNVGSDGLITAMPFACADEMNNGISKANRKIVTTEKICSLSRCRNEEHTIINKGKSALDKGEGNSIPPERLDLEEVIYVTKTYGKKIFGLQERGFSVKVLDE